MIIFLHTLIMALMIIRSEKLKSWQHLSFGSFWNLFLQVVYLQRELQNIIHIMFCVFLFTYLLLHSNENLSILMTNVRQICTFSTWHSSIHQELSVLMFNNNVSLYLGDRRPPLPLCLLDNLASNNWLIFILGIYFFFFLKRINLTQKNCLSM